MVTLAFASLAAPVQVIVGDWAGREVAVRQPVKLAAMEGLQQTPGGGAVHVRRVLRRGPRRGALRARRCRGCCRCWPSTTRNHEVIGLESVPVEDRPPVNIVRFAFQTMVGIGTGLALLGRVVHLGDLAPARAARVAVVLPGGDGSPGRCRSSR